MLKAAGPADIGSQGKGGRLTKEGSCTLHGPSSLSGRIVFLKKLFWVRLCRIESCEEGIVWMWLHERQIGGERAGEGEEDEEPATKNPQKNSTSTNVPSTPGWRPDSI